MKVIIAEKPSVARSIAAIVGATTKKEGCLEGNGYIVTHAIGHLIELANPSIEDKKWADVPLPILEGLTLKEKNDKGVKKQLRIIRDLFGKSDEIIVATDAGREGELIFRYIYEHLHCKKPFKRLWISSLTDTAIRDGMKNLKEGHNYDNLYYAGKGRSEADWYVGINATRALTLKGGLKLTLGRVQTPTLAIICFRFIENRDFKSMPYWNVLALTEKNGVKFEIRLPVRYMDKAAADTMKEKVSGVPTFRVLSVTKSEKKEQTPLLYDLTGLQKAASTRLSLTPDETLEIAQKLYEAKYITYPRTGSAYISEDVFAEIEPLIKKSASLFSLSSDKIPQGNLSRPSVNDKKVTDHHALLPTEILPDLDSLSKTELSLYKMIVFRMLEAFHAPCIKDVTRAEIDVAGEKCVITGSIIKSAGWRAVQGKDITDDDGEKEKNEDEQTLPILQEGDILPNNGVSIKEGKTTPPPLLTDATLLSYMETAGKECADEDEREAMKECGLGTPATRAAIIDKLTKEYISRKNKKLIPTERGLQVYEIIKEKSIGKPALTGQWEKILGDVEKGAFSYDKFIFGVKGYTTSLVKELQATDIKIDNPQQQIKELLPICPKCKTKKLHLFQKGISCDRECGFVLWNEVAGKKLSNAELVKLIETGKTDKINGFKNKAGRKYEAVLKLTDDFKTTFEFENKK